MEQNMTELPREQLSALADDELEHAEVELLLHRYAADRELRIHWSAYHVIGEAMRRGRPAHGACRLADRVAAEIDAGNGNERPVRVGNHRRHWKKLWQPVGAVAIAASVGVVAVFVVRGQGSNQAPIIQTTSSPRSTQRPTSGYNTVSNTRWNQGSPRVRRELNEYLSDHNENAPTLGRQGMLPYVHMATYDADTPAVRMRRNIGQQGGGE
jgi:sigma-E factor negative regulatory protein RseA